MGKGVNKVIIVGNVGQEPETKAMPSGSMVVNLSIATSESWKDKQTGQAQERTEWHKVVFFNRLAEIVAQYVNKGSKLYIEGSLRTRSWDQDGVKRYSTEIVGSEMQMLDSKGDNQQQNKGFHPVRSSVTNVTTVGDKTSEHQAQNAVAAKAAIGEWEKGLDDGFDDDIPF